MTDPRMDPLANLMFSASPLGMALLPLDGRVQRATRALCELTGRAERELVGAAAADLVHPDDRAAHGEQAQRLLSGELTATTFGQRLITPAGAEVPVRFVLSLARDADGRPERLVVQAEDRAEHERLERRVRFEAEHDSLTGLYNRAAFGAILQRHLTFSRRYEREGVLVLVDLDRFHGVNEVHGPGAGDELLRAAATAIKGRLRESDVIARLGSDEFGLLLPEVDGEEGRRTVDHVLSAIAGAAVQMGNRRLRVTASAGLSHFGGGGARTTEEAFTEADVALMAAKEEGRARAVLYDERVREAHAGARLRRSWAEKVRGALDDGSFLLDCQPIVDAPDGDVVAYELFLRMLDEDGTVVRPNWFLHLAERHGLMPAIDEWVIGRAIAMAAARAAAERPVTLAVNVSSESVANPALLRAVVAMLGEHPEAGPQLMFELTESTATANVAQVAGFMARLKQFGCRFSLDDFGSGSGSFAQLKRLPFDLVKLDGEFTRALPYSPEDQAIVGALISVARSLGMSVVAECVEDADILDAVCGFGVDLVQGLHVGRPARIGDVLGLEVGAA